MEIEAFGVSHRISYSVKTDIYESLKKFSTHINMKIDNCTLDEVLGAICDVKVVVNKTEAAASLIISKGENDGAS